MKNKFLVIGVVSLTFFFTNCKKDDDQSMPDTIPKEEHPSDTCLLTKVISQYNGDSMSYDITYNKDATVHTKIGYELWQPINLTYTYHDNGFTASGSWTDEYDKAGRLLLHKEVSLSIAYSYDERGNLLKKAQSGPSRYSSTNYYEYNLNNQKTSEYKINKWYGPGPYTYEKDESVYDYSNPLEVVIKHYKYLTQSENKPYIYTDTSQYATTIEKYDSDGLLITATSTYIPPSNLDRHKIYEWDEYKNLVKEEWFDSNNESMYLMEYNRTYDLAGRLTSVTQYRDNKFELYYRYVYTCWD